MLPFSHTKDMSVKVIFFFIIIIALVAGGIYLKQSKQPDQTTVPLTQTSTTQEASTAGKIRPFDFGNKSFRIDDQTLVFKDGSFALPDNSSTAKIESKVMSTDGMHAAAVIVDQPGGSGTFYYLVGAFMKDGKELYSEPVLLGDRIQLQNVKIEDPRAEDNGEITVTFLDRGVNDSMAAPPTKQMIKKYSYEENGNLIEVLN